MKNRAKIVDKMTDELGDADIPYTLLFIDKEGNGNLITNLEEDEMVLILERTLNHFKDEKKKSIADRLGELFSWKDDKIDEN